MCSGGDKVDLADWGWAKSNMQTRRCSCQPEMQRLTQFCGQVKLWHRPKKMESRNKRVFSCTWGRTASSLRKGCAVKGWETRLRHKLYSGETRKKNQPPQTQNSSTSLCNMVSCISQKGSLLTNLFRIFQSRFHQGRREVLIPLCMFE